jgi:hypothetical protein
MIPDADTRHAAFGATGTPILSCVYRAHSSGVARLAGDAQPNGHELLHTVHVTCLFIQTQGDLVMLQGQGRLSLTVEQPGQILMRAGVTDRVTDFVEQPKRSSQVVNTLVVVPRPRQGVPQSPAAASLGRRISEPQSGSDCDAQGCDPVIQWPLNSQKSTIVQGICQAWVS